MSDQERETGVVPPTAHGPAILVEDSDAKAETVAEPPYSIFTRGEKMWISWFLAILTGVYLLVILLLLPETQRKIVGNGSIKTTGIRRSLVSLVVLDRIQEAEQNSTRKRQCRVPNPFSCIKLLCDKEILNLNRKNNKHKHSEVCGKARTEKRPLPEGKRHLKISHRESPLSGIPPNGGHQCPRYHGRWSKPDEGNGKSAPAPLKPLGQTLAWTDRLSPAYLGPPDHAVSDGCYDLMHIHGKTILITGNFQTSLLVHY
ncbi:hypothetical protein PG996_005301 [Apiospora saccharicola]|uniref:Uncharacterized protein n=1 Tax=Apiospora saccharicola TaxID=335842 RepID=A0ABR1VL25_9PEZI